MQCINGLYSQSVSVIVDISGATFLSNWKLKIKFCKTGSVKKYELQSLFHLLARQEKNQSDFFIFKKVQFDY